jgi:hypothetical protein
LAKLLTSSHTVFAGGHAKDGYDTNAWIGERVRACLKAGAFTKLLFFMAGES